MAEAERTTNPIRLVMLALDIKKSLAAALAEDPESVEVRLDLVRFHAVTPRVAGGDIEEARRQTAEIARRDAALGRFAAGYLAYRDKQYGRARIELREAIRSASNPTHKAEAMRWLGWLSQESQQWSDAFELFAALGDDYEIGRTAAFCKCELERGKAALQRHIATRPKNLEKAREYLKQIEAAD
jgi:TolA-binding protein